MNSEIVDIKSQLAALTALVMATLKAVTTLESRLELLGIAKTELIKMFDDTDAYILQDTRLSENNKRVSLKVNNLLKKTTLRSFDRMLKECTQ